MSEQSPAPQTLGQTGTTIRWVDQARVADVDSATDGFQIFLALATLTGGAALGGVLILFAGVVHPIALYIAMAVAITATVTLGLAAERERRRLRTARINRDNSTMSLPLSFTVVAATGSPTFTVGLQEESYPRSITGSPSAAGGGPDPEGLSS